MCIAAYPRQNASTACGNAIKATQLMLRFAGLRAHSPADSHNSLRTCKKRAAALFCAETCSESLRCLLALCEAYGEFGCSAGDCNCQRAARAEPRRHQTQALAQWGLAAWAWSQHCRCPRAFGPPERCLDAVLAQLCPVACHHQPLDVCAVVCQHHQID